MTFTDRPQRKSVVFTGVVATLVAAIFLFKFLLFSGKPENPIQVEAIPPHQTKASLVENHPDSTATPASAPVNVVMQSRLSVQTQTLLHTLTEIFNSKNDNDPRLDRDFRNLTVEAKTALRAKYAELPKEDRNARGTIALLIGREIQNSADIAFLKEVLSEPPCLSLMDCGSEAHTSTGTETHQDIGIGVTLAYPQMSTLYWLEKFFTSPPTGATPPGLQEEARKAIEVAKASQVPMIRARAIEIEKKLRRFY